MTEEMSGVQAFKENRMIVGLQVLQQQFVLSGENYEWFAAEEVKEVQFTPVIMYTEAFTFKCAGTAPAITETVKYYPDTLFLQCGDLVEHIHYPAVVRRIWYIEAYKVYYPVPGSIVHKVQIRSTNIAKIILSYLSSGLTAEIPEKVITTEMKKAVIAVISDLSTDMRVRKLALLMAEEGIDVTLIGRLSACPLPPEIPGVKATRIWVPFRKGPAMYLMFNLFLFFRLLFMRYRLCVASDLDTLTPCYLVSWLFRRALIYDSHEYFTGQYGLEERRFKHFLWKSAERFLVPRVKHMITVSDSIADIYRREYGINPLVVRNVAPDTGHLEPHRRSELGAKDDEFLVVFQGSGINPGRGGEELVSAMAMTEGVRLIFIGSGDAMDLLRRSAAESPASDRITFLPRMPWEEMIRYTMCCDAGLSADTDTCTNQRYSLPNKFFDYIAAGIPAVVSPLPEVSALVEYYGCGTVLEAVTPDAIARELQRLADDPSLLPVLKERTRAARQELTWEKEKLREQELIRNVIKSKSNK